MRASERYHLAGKFGEEFNLANWRGILKNAKLKVANFEIYTLNGMRPRIFTFQLLIYCSPPNASVNVIHFHFSERNFHTYVAICSCSIDTFLDYVTKNA